MQRLEDSGAVRPIHGSLGVTRLMSETCWAHNKWNKIASDIKLVFHSSTIAMMHGPINISVSDVRVTSMSTAWGRHIHCPRFVTCVWGKVGASCYQRVTSYTFSEHGCQYGGICTIRWTNTVNPLKPSGHYMYRQFNIHNSKFCPHSVFICFVLISEQTAIISLYSINWLVFITETECVYCAVRTGYLNVIQA